MKNVAEEKYDFIFSFDDDKLQSTQLYIQFVEDIISQMLDILDTYDKKVEYGKLLYKHELSYSANHYIVWYKERDILDKLRFEDFHFFGIKFTTIQKWIKIIELHKITNNKK